MSDITKMIFLYALCSVVMSGCTTNGQSRDYNGEPVFHKYQESLSYLRANKSFSLPNDYVVSNQVIDIRNYLDLYLQYLPGLEEKSADIPPEFSLVKDELPYLSKLSSRRGSKNVLFFSNVMDGVFFLEVFEGFSRRSFNYEDAPTFGSSSIYIFSCKDSENSSLKMLYNGKLSYN